MEGGNVKELWKEHRGAYTTVLAFTAFVVGPLIEASNSDHWAWTLTGLAMATAGGFLTAIMLNVLIEMEVDKRLKEKD